MVQRMRMYGWANRVRGRGKKRARAAEERAPEAVERAGVGASVEAVARLYESAPEEARAAYRAAQPVTAEVLEAHLRARDVESLSRGRGES